MNKTFPFKIGSDPEFSIILDHKRIAADKLITTLYKKDHEPENSKDSSEDNMGYKVGQSGVIGWDGVSSTGELRPAPSNDPLELVNNIGELVKSFANKVKIFKLSTASSLSPLGGHVHFQIPPALHNRETAIDNLHKKLSSFYLPLLLSEDVVNSRVRQKLGDSVNQPYGRITDFRIDYRDKEETIQTLELRTPSAEWLTNPDVARAIICYLATVYNEIVYQPKAFKKCQAIIFNTKKQSLALQEIAISQYTMISKIMMGKLKYFIRKFEFYQQYKKEIELAMNPEKMLAMKRKADFDIISGWDLSSKEPTKKQLLSESQLKKEATNISNYLDENGKRLSQNEIFQNVFMFRDTDLDGTPNDYWSNDFEQDLDFKALSKDTAETFYLLKLWEAGINYFNQNLLK